MTYLVGVDVGTSSLKSVLVDSEGKILSSAREEYNLITPQPDFVELQPETYWIACNRNLRNLLNKAKVDTDEVTSIAVSSQAETLIALDKDGQPLRNAIIWIDNRSNQETDFLKTRIDAREFYETTGVPHLIPMCPATKILWIRRNEPKVFEKSAKFLLVEDYLIYRLSECFATDLSVISSTGLFDINVRKWWKEMLNEIAIAEDQLSTPYPSGTPVGHVSPKASKETGLNTKTLVATGALDGTAAAVGVGNINPGVVTETTGSVCGLLATVERPMYDRQCRIPCTCHAAPDLYCLTPCTETGGMLLKWFRDNFGIEEKTIEGRAGIDAFELLTMESTKIRPGSEGLVILPHLTGAESPEYNPFAKGVIFGITLRHSRAHFIKAIMESVAYALRRNVELLEEVGLAFTEIQSVGGAAKSLVWGQIKSDVLQKRLVVHEVDEAAALGTAILAGMASRTFSSMSEATTKFKIIRKITEPDSSNKETYDRSYEKYQLLYECLEPLFSKS